MTRRADALDRPALALGLRFVATLILSLIAVLAKLAGLHHVPLTELAFFRQFVPLVMLLVWLAARGSWRAARTDKLWIHARRTLIGIAGLYLIMGSYQLLPLAEATLYAFTAPVFAVLLAAGFLHEKVGVVRWSAVAMGLAGVVVMTAGGGGHQGLLGVGCAVGGAFCVALTAIQLRDLGRTEQPLVIVFWYFTITSLALAGPALATMPRFDGVQWSILLAAGFATLFSQLCLTGSVRYGNVSSVIVIDYATLGWAMVWGWLIFAQVPPARTWFGAPLIVTAGVVIILREAHVARRRDKPGQAPAAT
jgi:drug/metabolite transporter (DMT)-like permease